MPSRKVPQDPEKVQRIMQAALHTFAHHGYQRAKTDVIAAEAAVSKGLIFHYYGNKQALYLATVKWTVAQIRATIDPRVYAIPDDLVSLVVQGTKYKTAFGQAHPDEMQLMIAAYGEIDRLPPELQAELRGVYDESMQTVQTMIQQVLDRMPLRADLDRDLVVNLIMSTYTQIFTEFQTHMRQNADIHSMADVQWLVERAKVYMGILEHGFTKPEA
ncbi:TetR/AcrR family transcriptional regulator [Lactiplantibacillus modestisalitolerans]|uniref:TetR/AcrR family transcriptional regulator n=1 Tax=Lactiplantibacillus modestisalitolerans TaxID=1457219 RepID=A0ABV5WS27_9LACO|nr:TetR/AcrR family transcriptional regulator [Lactiplantibacillus modestisalitolerans]